MRRDERIPGLEYYRRKRRVSIKELRDLTGVEYSNLQRWRSVEHFDGINKLDALLKIADYLGVTMDQMAEMHYRWELDDGDRPQRASKNAADGNCISRYRVENGLSYRQLADRMGCSFQYANRVCRPVYPAASAIKRIADYEGISAETFIERYGVSA